MRFKVKIKQLNNVSGNLITANGNIRKVASDISGTASRMPLSNESYRIIKDSLKKVEEKLNSYNDTVSDMSRLLSQISSLYDSTEQGILDEYELTSHNFLRDDVLPVVLYSFMPPAIADKAVEMIPGYDKGRPCGLDPHIDFTLKKNKDGSHHLEIDYSLMDDAVVDAIDFGSYHKETTKSIFSGHYSLDLDLKMRNADGELAPNLDISNIDIDSEFYEVKDKSWSDFYEKEIIFAIGTTTFSGSGNIEIGKNDTKVKFKGEGETSGVKFKREAKYGTDDDNYYDKEELNIINAKGEFDYDSTREEGKKLKAEGSADVADASAEIGYNKDGKHGDVGLDISILGVDGSTDDNDLKSSSPLQIDEDSISIDGEASSKYVNLGFHANYESDEPFSDTILRDTFDYLRNRPSKTGNADKIRRMLKS